MTLSWDDPQPVRTVLASMGLPAHVTDTATVLMDGMIISDHGAGRVRLCSRHGGLCCMRVHCGRLRGGMNKRDEPDSVEGLVVPLNTLDLGTSSSMLLVVLSLLKAVGSR